MIRILRKIEKDVTAGIDLFDAIYEHTSPHAAYDEVVQLLSDATPGDIKLPASEKLEEFVWRTKLLWRRFTDETPHGCIRQSVRAIDRMIEDFDERTDAFLNAAVLRELVVKHPRRITETVWTALEILYDRQK